MNLARAAVLLIALPLIVGCPRPASVDTSSAPPDETDKPAAVPQAKSDKMKITAYINVTSGCQAETVALVNKLAMDHADKVELEMVDFGSTEGADRWRQDGLECMTLLFNGSPVVKFPGSDGRPRVVVFAMPAGFSWTHEDLQDAFAAIEQGTAQALTEDQARAELAPKPTTLHTAAREEGSQAVVEVNGTPVLQISATVGDATPMQRATAASEAIEAWAAQPIHPSELNLADLQDGIAVVAKGTQVIKVTAADAKAAGVDSAKQLAVQWLTALKRSVDEAAEAGAPAAGAQ